MLVLVPGMEFLSGCACGHRSVSYGNNLLLLNLNRLLSRNCNRVRTHDSTEFHPKFKFAGAWKHQGPKLGDIMHSGLSPEGKRNFVSK